MSIAADGSASSWYKLDNAAKIYPVLRGSRHITIFRLQAVLRENVVPEILQTALDRTLARFPYFNVGLRQGFFWYYLEGCTHALKIEPDVANPLRPFNKRELGRNLLRVRYGERLIAVEYFHSLTDGYGGGVFLKTLVGVYLQLCGREVQPGNGFRAVDEPPLPAEAEDAYKRHSTLRSVRRPGAPAAFHVHGTPFIGHRLRIITGIIPVKAIHAKAKTYGVSITELLTACYLEQLYKIQQNVAKTERQRNLPVVVSVPVNVRSFFPTDTLRNFSLYATPGIEPANGVYTFEEILKSVHHFMRYTVTRKYLSVLMGANVNSEKSMVLRLTPLPLKVLAMRAVYVIVGESRFTSSLSNLGATVIPAGFEQFVERFDFLLGPSRVNTVNCGVISFNDRLSISFTSTIRETEVERAFFTRLVSLGIPVQILSNHLPNGSPA
jgi:NRPS condensation-like uncharacterized protein